MDPLDPLTAILLLLPPQYQLHEELLELLVAIVDAKLFKTEAKRAPLKMHLKQSGLVPGKVQICTDLVLNTWSIKCAEIMF